MENEHSVQRLQKIRRKTTSLDVLNVFFIKWRDIQKLIGNRYLLCYCILFVYLNRFVGMLGENPANLMTDGCGNLLCKRTCYNAADLSWPQVIHASLTEQA